MNERNRFAPAAAVYSKIAEIGCDDGVFRMQFAEANEAQVRKIGPAIGIAGG